MGLLKDREPSAAAELTADLIRAAKKVPRMKYLVNDDFNAGWATGRRGDVVDLTEEQGRLLAHWVEPVEVKAVPKEKAVEPVEASPEDDVPGAPPVLNTMISSRKPGGMRPKGRRRSNG